MLLRHTHTTSEETWTGTRNKANEEHCRSRRDLRSGDEGRDDVDQADEMMCLPFERAGRSMSDNIARSGFPCAGSKSHQISNDPGDYGRKRAILKRSEDGRSIPTEQKANVMERFVI
jgi:hypothetical protein